MLRSLARSALRVGHLHSFPFSKRLSGVPTVVQGELKKPENAVEEKKTNEPKPKKEPPPPKPKAPPIMGPFVILGIGNPGPEYVDTRHNAGFWFADSLLEEFKDNVLLERESLSMSRLVDDISGVIKRRSWAHELPVFRSTSSRRFDGDVFVLSIENRLVIVIKPKTYVNLSGIAFSQFASMITFPEPSPVSLPLSHYLIAYDELNLSPGMARLKPKGSGGGHNGMKSIIEQTKNENILRLKIGIGHATTETAKYVLSNASKTERRSINGAIRKSIEGTKEWIKGDLNKAMMIINTD